MAPESSPAARALMTLELIQASPGITAAQVGAALGVSERAARRYVGILRDAEIPVDSLTGPYGGYTVGRGVRLPPLRFTASEALGLVMAVLEGHRGAADPADLVGRALGKILRALPEPMAGPVRAVRATAAAVPSRTVEPADRAPVDPDLTEQLVGAASAGRRLHLTYRTSGGSERPMDVDPWAVVLRHSLWYLLCWSHSAGGQRVLRIDRVLACAQLPETFAVPVGLDALRVLEEHLSQGWPLRVDVLVEAGVEQVAGWLPRSLARLEADGENRTRLVATTNNPQWYASRLAVIPAPFRVLGGDELVAAVAALGRQLLQASGQRPNSLANTFAEADAELWGERLADDAPLEPAEPHEQR